MLPNKINSLRNKMLVIVGTSLLAIFALIYFVARHVLLDGYAQLETDKTNIQINSAKALLNEQVNQLSAQVRDNAH